MGIILHGYNKKKKAMLDPTNQKIVCSIPFGWQILFFETTK
jgi:hypothetical protein